MKKINAILALVLLPLLAFAWREKTHKLLSAYACINSKLLKDSFIWKLNLEAGFTHPLAVKNEIKTVAGWVYSGSEKEDEGNIFFWDRSGRHFHNPLLVFNQAGLTRWIPTKQQLQSSILWAQDGIEQEKLAEGNMSWQKVKEYYFYALISDFEEKRHLNLGLMFKGLGHQMHLVQDMGNPEHTRNDNHPFMTMEKWVENHYGDEIKKFCENPIFPDIDLQTNVFDQSTQTTLVPISRLSDADVYDPSSPTPSVGFKQGLAEYSNANFLSSDTIFSSGFPFPRSSGLNMQFPELISEYVADEKGIYSSRRADGEGEAIEHFVRAVYLQKYLGESGNDLYYRIFMLDDKCFNDYSHKLIPRAVGYSAALLDYFFRGEMEVSLPPNDGVYSFCSVPSEGFKDVSLMVRNISSSNEELRNGHISLVISYRLGGSTPFVPNPPIPDVERKYKLYQYANPSDPRDPDKPIDIPRDVPIRLDFDLKNSPLPTEAVDVTLTLVFKGDLGVETGDAVAIGFKDISEPTPIDLFNNTDKVCFQGSYVNYDDATLWDVVDINPKNGRIDCLNNAEINITRQRIKPIYLSFNGKPATSSNYFYKYENGLELLPGEMPHRVFILTDTAPVPFSYSVLVHAESMEYPDMCFVGYDNNVKSFIPYTNKLVWVESTESDSGHFEHIRPSIGNFRGFSFWMLKYFQNAKVPANSNCSGSGLAEGSTSSALMINKSLGHPIMILISPKMESADSPER